MRLRLTEIVTEQPRAFGERQTMGPREGTSTTPSVPSASRRPVAVRDELVDVVRALEDGGSLLLLANGMTMHVAETVEEIEAQVRRLLTEGLGG